MALEHECGTSSIGEGYSLASLVAEKPRRGDDLALGVPREPRSSQLPVLAVPSELESFEVKCDAPSGSYLNPSSKGSSCVLGEEVVEVGNPRPCAMLRRSTELGLKG